MSKKDAAVYRKAAERLCKTKYECSCSIIRIAQGEHYPLDENWGRVATRYAAAFKPFDDTPLHCSWGDQWEDDATNCRILALCFAAAMAETEDL